MPCCGCCLGSASCPALQALKSGAVYYRFTGDESGIASSYKRMQLLDTYHGVPSGVFQADEHLVSAPPSCVALAAS